MKALVYTSHSGYALYKIKNKDKTGYYLYNINGGVWYSYSRNVQIIEDNVTVDELKITKPEYFL